mmetsp:Transcript_15413/g.35414  ORF Transcript_15413/g.35414 Transcript_15413/m.35414 type:complete len:369 (+) Transcript_15413:84-1190(+)
MDLLQADGPKGDALGLRGGERHSTDSHTLIAPAPILGGQPRPIHPPNPSQPQADPSVGRACLSPDSGSEEHSSPREGLRLCDVVCGRGSGANLHPGNQDFRVFLGTRLDDYTRSKPKGLFVENIYQSLQEKDIRFLKKTKDGTYEELPKPDALKKIDKCFTDMRKPCPTKRHQSIRQGFQTPLGDDQQDSKPSTSKQPTHHDGESRFFFDIAPTPHEAIEPLPLRITQRGALHEPSQMLLRAKLFEYAKITRDATEMLMKKMYDELTAEDKRLQGQPDGDEKWEVLDERAGLRKLAQLVMRINQKDAQWEDGNDRARRTTQESLDRDLVELPIDFDGTCEPIMDWAEADSLFDTNNHDSWAHEQMNYT